MKPIPRGLVTFLVYTLSLAGFLYLLRFGLDYYRTPLITRPRHELFWLLKPGGTLGHAYGVAGSALMLAMLVYTLRKRLRFLRRWGKLRGWLRFHIFCGIFGPLLIVLHSSFKVQGLVALSFWSMVLVALSGFLGRYLYLQIPRRASGVEMSLQEVEALGDELEGRLRQEFGLGEEIVARIAGIGDASARPGRPLLLLLLGLPFDGLLLRARMRGLRRGVGHRAVPRLAELLELAVRRADLRRRALLWHRLQALFHYWHVLHKPFAVVMYIFMFVHIGVAIATGYLWPRPF